MLIQATAFSPRAEWAQLRREDPFEEMCRGVAHPITRGLRLGPFGPRPNRRNEQASVDGRAGVEESRRWEESEGRFGGPRTLGAIAGTMWPGVGVQ